MKRGVQTPRWEDQRAAYLHERPVIKERLRVGEKLERRAQKSGRGGVGVSAKAQHTGGVPSWFARTVVQGHRDKPSNGLRLVALFALACVVPLWLAVALGAGVYALLWYAAPVIYRLQVPRWLRWAARLDWRPFALIGAVLLSVGLVTGLLPLPLSNGLSGWGPGNMLPGLPVWHVGEWLRWQAAVAPLVTAAAIWLGGWSAVELADDVAPRRDRDGGFASLTDDQLRRFDLSGEAQRRERAAAERRTQAPPTEAESVSGLPTLESLAPQGPSEVSAPDDPDDIDEGAVPPPSLPETEQEPGEDRAGRRGPHADEKEN